MNKNEEVLTEKVKELTKRVEKSELKYKGTQNAVKHLVSAIAIFTRNEEVLTEKVKELTKRMRELEKQMSWVWKNNKEPKP